MDERVEYVRLPDGCRIWTATDGAGAPVVLCHGGPGLWDYLAPIGSMISDVAVTHRWDQRGGGRSSALPPYTLDRFVDDLEALRVHFDHPAWIVAGHSWGATLALAYALRYPGRTRALAYINGTGIGTSWRDADQAEREKRLRASGNFERWRDLHSRTRTTDEERELCVITWATDYADATFGRNAALEMVASGFTPNYEVNAALSRVLDNEETMIERCAKLEMPALIIHGERDPRPASAVTSLARALPHAELRILEAAGHLPWADQPDSFAGILRAFIRTVAPLGSPDVACPSSQGTSRAT
jgi:proline iminopeptidase